MRIANLFIFMELVMHNASKLSCLIFVSILTFAVYSCTKDSVNTFEREKLFTISFGRLEDELDLFNLGSQENNYNTQLVMRDGMFYIANSGSRKILQLTSFGDLLTLIYDPNSNPVPSFAKPQDISSQKSDNPQITTTRKAVAYPLINPTLITVDSKKRIFVVDRIPDDRFEFDNESGVVLKDVVLFFGSDGQFIDYLGQEGLGGTPFPPIMGLYTNAKNEVIIVTKTQSAVKVFWFNADGFLLYRIPFNYNALPSIYDKSAQVYTSLEKIIPDYSSPVLYVKLDYYSALTDSATKSNVGISFDKSCIYPLNLQTGAYEERIDLPSYSATETDVTGTVTVSKPYEMLGVSNSGWIFLTTPIESGYFLELVDIKSRQIVKRLISIDPDQLSYNALSLSSDGIISALLASEYEASVVWWRTDSLIGEIRQ